MGTRKVTLTGVASWAKVFEDNRDLEGYEGSYRDHEGACTIDVTLSDTEFDKLKAAGSIKKGRKTDEGETTVKLTRKFKDKFKWASGAPTVVDSADEPWDYSVKGIIPNGSIVELEVSVYDTSRPSIKGTRLESVKVLHLAEMEEASEPEESKEAEEEVSF